ncbi:hypothetical protein HX862_13495 [Pseudomonas sp. D5002]|uniref:hypothetical protein n=1 Tax=Pseudomonas sp. D5002 TaxID=2738818 RepID=UPI0015A24A55|nr:hypothetical protein [Pseudomonas sp. D5002]NWB08920.1 hypothetical protein [Pseudomonas sp. D5002]
MNTNKTVILILVALLLLTLISTILYYMYQRGAASGTKNREAASDSFRENNCTQQGSGNSSGAGTTPKYDKKIKENIEYEISMLPNFPADEINLEIQKIITKINSHSGKYIAASDCASLIKKAKSQKTQKPTIIVSTQKINNITNNESTEQITPNKKNPRP